MLTPQEIQEATFSKAVFGGYDMQQVDQLLEQTAGDYTTLYKENAELKEKLRVLVQRLVEIRDKGVGTEEAERKTKETCDSMLRETRRKCDEMLREAESRGSAERIAEEEERLACAKKTALNFIDVIERDIRGHLELLESLKSRDLSEEKKQAAPQAPYDYERDENRQRKADREREIVSEIDANLTKQGVVEPLQEHTPAPKQTREADEDERPTIKFDNLQFGENYSLSAD